MRKILLALFVLLLVLPTVAQDAADWPRTLTDGLGTEVTIDAPPQRIVSLTLSNDAVLFDLVGPERLAAITRLSTDPGISNIAARADQVGTTIASASDVEQVISLEPDIVFVASFTAPEVVQQYRDVGLTVFSTGTPDNFDAIRDNIRLIGQAVGEADRAEALIAEMDDELATVAAAVADVAEPLRVLYLTPNNYTSGVDSSIAELIRSAGGIDVAEAAGIDQFAPLSDEFIIEQNPDVILLTGWTPFDPTFLDTFFNNPAFAGLTALQTGRVYPVHSAHISTVTHYVSEGVQDVAALLYPDEYPTYPLSVDDATGADITIPTEPGAIIVAGEANAEVVSSVVGAMMADEEPGFDILVTDLQDSLSTERDAVVFIPASADDPPVAADVVTVVRLYEGDTGAAVVENTLIVGAALNARPAAINLVNGITDALEAAAE